MTRKIRVLLAKPGLDGHDRGVKVVARALRDAGMEVIYTGLHKSPAQIVDVALQEDVDVIGLSSLSGAHMALFPRIMDLLKENNMFDDTLVVVGGIIPDVDVPKLNEIGIHGIFATRGKNLCKDEIRSRRSGINGKNKISSISILWGTHLRTGRIFKQGILHPINRTLNGYGSIFPCTN